MTEKRELLGPAVPEPVCANEFLTLPFPPREMLLAPWLPEKGPGMIAAPRGLGKTFVALNVAHAVATGGSFLRWRAPKRRRVLYIDGEMPAVVLQDRLRHIVDRSMDVLLHNALALLAADQCEQGLPSLSTLEGQQQIRPRLDPFDLIILDNISTLCRGGRENEAESWGLMQEFALELRRAGKSVLLIDHTGKAGQSARGTSKKEDVLDSVLLLKRPSDYESSEGARFVVHFEKARGFTGSEAEPFEAALNPEDWSWSMAAVSENRDDEIRELKDRGLSLRAIEEQLGIPKSTVARAVARMNGHT